MKFSLTAVSSDTPALAAISPRREMGAYEALWLESGATFKSIAAKFAADPTALPSDFVEPSLADRCAADVMKMLKAAGVDRFGVRVNHAGPPRCQTPDRTSLLPRCMGADRDAMRGDRRQPKRQR
jgi:hypothetical protein